MVTLTDVSRAVGLEVVQLREIFSEKPGASYPKDLLDKVYDIARQMGYDFRKLKIGKRMNLRKEILGEILQQIESHPGWKRREIIRYLSSAQEMVERVQKRTFHEEFIPGS